MKNFIKLIFIIVLVFLTSICFAGQVEEYNELKDNVLEPITAHFSDSSSLSRLISIKMIEMQKMNGKVVDPTHIKLMIMKDRARSEVREEVGSKRFEEMDKIIPLFCQKYSKRTFTGLQPDFAKDLLTTLVSVAWDYNVANCEAQMRIVLIALDFNRLNYAVRGQKWLFKEAAVVKAKPPGDHYFVLVQGLSDTMFAVDPWSRKVTILEDTATKLSAISADPLINDYPDPQKKLNKLFEASDDKGIKYYDEIYVRENTEWILRRDVTIGYEQFVNTFDPAPKRATASDKAIDIQEIKDKNLHMEDLYNHLEFPSWQVEYKQLFIKTNVPKRRNPEDESILDL